MGSRRLTDKLLDASIESARQVAVTQSATLRFGVVTAVNTGAKTLTATIAGKSIKGIPYMASYSPAAADAVWLLHQGSTLIAIGKR